MKSPSKTLNTRLSWRKCHPCCIRESATAHASLGKSYMWWRGSVRVMTRTKHLKCVRCLTWRAKPGLQYPRWTTPDTDSQLMAPRTDSFMSSGDFRSSAARFRAIRLRDTIQRQTSGRPTRSWEVSVPALLCSRWATNPSYCWAGGTGKVRWISASSWPTNRRGTRSLS